MFKLPITVLIITKDEAANIRDCLESVQWADEIFIVDSGSSDKTIEIAKEYTEKICYHHFENFAQQRNWAQFSLPIKNEWVLHLDADERIDEELFLALKDKFLVPLNCDGFMLPRKTIFYGRWIKHGGHYPVYHLRIFKKSKGRCEDRLYDQHFICEGNISTIKGNIINVITPDLREWKKRHRRWAKLEALEILSKKDMAERKRLGGTQIEKRKWLRYNIYYKMPLFIRTFMYFIYRYIIRLGFLDGWQGLIFHFWQGLWYKLLVDKEIYKLMREK